MISNEIVKKILLTGDKFIPELQDILVALLDCLLIIMRGFKNSKKQMI